MSEEKVIDKCNSKENVNSSQIAAESSKQTLPERRSASGTQETNTEDANTKRESNISLKSFKMCDQNYVMTDDEESKTYNNKNSADNIIQEEENTAKCCNCLSEVSEFVPWFCINIGKWISNSFKNCCCCNKKIDKRKLDIDIDYDDWDPNAANNDGELYRYSLPLDDGVKVTFHQNKGFDVNDEVKDDKKVNKGDDDENKEPVKKGNHHHEYETVRSDDIHRSSADHSTGHASGHSTGHISGHTTGHASGHSTGHTSEYSTGHTTDHSNTCDIVSDSSHNHANNHSDFAASHHDSGFGGHSGGCDFSSDW